MSANKIGRIANKNGLKTDEFGKFFLDKSAHSSKQVEAFRYNENGISALRHIIHGKEVPNLHIAQGWACILDHIIIFN